MITTVYILFLMAMPEWGFFGHRLINRVAVYTLPTEMINWYKPNIDYLSDHAVDPDKRRYATRHEAVRHYIDLDQWGTFPFDHLPKDWEEILALNIEAFTLTETDTHYLLHSLPMESWSTDSIDISGRLRLVREHYLKRYYDDDPSITGDTFHQLFPLSVCDSASVIYLHDGFTEHGILPYHLLVMQHRLTNAFKENNSELIMRLSAEIGHYIGDACVPLHTTSNYNGQLTDQVGIHAFWESRIPELFALEEFDLVVGTATYIEDPAGYFWDLVFDSHREVNQVLTIEKELRETYPSDKQFCFENRLNQIVRTQCAGYAEAYHLRMDKMVEDRFRVAVKALGDAWYTAWIDAGQPSPPALSLINAEKSADEEIENAFRIGKPKGREHE